jgi:hypothetical protein
MKKFIYILFLAVILISDSCVLFETCDGVRYQIKEKIDIGNEMCKYKAQSIGSCLIWNDQTHVTFIDSCKVYDQSTILDRDALYNKYGI